MGANLSTKAVFERGDDSAAIGVILWVSTRHHQHIQRQPQVIAADLDIALLQNIKQRDLNSFDKIRQLVYCKNSAIRARDQTKMNRLWISQRATFSDFDRINVTD